MATLYITEFQEVTQGAQGQLAEVAALPALAEQTVAIAGSSAASSAFNAVTKYVRLHTDATCSVAFGTNPTATAAKMRLQAGQTEYFGVPVGQSYKVAVITNT